MSKRRIVNMGVANEDSICAGIGEKLDGRGDEQVYVYYPPMRSRVEKAVGALAGTIDLIPCDFSSVESMGQCRHRLRRIGDITGIVHGIASADRNDLQGDFTDITLGNFNRCMDISVYSLIATGGWAKEIVTPGGSIMTLTYNAGDVTLPHYNIMGVAKAGLEASMRYLATQLGQYGIRVNAISASPENTLSARGIRHFRYIGQHDEGMSPMGRRANIREIASASAFLLSDESSGITGQVIFVDCGTSIVHMAPSRNAERMAKVYTGIHETLARETELKNNSD